MILAGELAGNHDANLTDTQVQYASVIHSSGTDLLRLLDDILDLAKVESGTVTLEISELLLAELRGGLERDFVHVAEQKGVAFSVALAPDLPASISTDPGRLRQVLKNLLSNAFKFTEEGEVSLHVGLAHSGWTPGHEKLGRASAVTAFTVTDTGIGITAELQRRMFEAFAQADGTTARQYGGTGLGLSISRELVRLLGGEIALTSTPDEGSTFTVYLPSSANGSGNGAAVALLAPAGPIAEPPTRAAHPPRHPQGDGLAGKKALVVDDDIRNVFALTSLLERCGLDVISTQRGEEAVAILERTPEIDIVLMDIMMPIMDGYAAMRAMRALPASGDVPIVAVTAAVEAGERQRCIDAGATAYVTKPVDTASLLVVLDEWLPSDLPAGGPIAALG